MQFARLLSDPSQEEILDGILMTALLSANTLHFIFDCFDITPPTLEIEDIVWSEAFGWQRNDAFERVVRYLYDTKGNQFYKILFHLCAHPWSLWTKKREEKERLRSNLKYLLGLLHSHLEHNQEIKPEVNKLHYMARFFIYSDSDDLSQSFFKLSIYYSDEDFTDLMRNEIIEYFKDNDWTSGHIKQTLDILQKLDKNNVLIGLSRLILIKEPETFILFYEPRRPEDENYQTRLLSNRDCYGMSYLHRAALHNHHETFQNLLALSTDSEGAQEIYQILINTNDGFSPFYVAAACGHQNICHQIMNFIKEFPDFADRIRDGMANENGFFNRPLQDSIEFNQRKMTRTILDSVKNDISSIHFNDWVFQNDETIKLLPLIESDTLKEMFDSGGGFRNWMDRLMGIGVNRAFSEVLSSEHLLHHLAKLDLLPPLVDILISLQPTNKEGKSTSYWYQFVDGQSWKLTIFLKRVSKCFDENELERLLLPRDPNNIHFQPLVMWGRRLTNFEFLPEKLQNEIYEQLRKQIPRLIDYLLQNEFDLANCTYPISLFYNIRFCLENGDEDQLKTLSHYLSVDMLKPKLLDSQVIWKDITALFSKKLSNSNRTAPYYEGFNKIIMDFKRERQRLKKETEKRFPFHPMRIT